MTGRRGRALRLAAAVYLTALAASHLVRVFRPEAGPPSPGESVVRVQPRPAGPPATTAVRIAYRDYPGTDPTVPVVVVLHGSPGSKGQVLPLARALRGPGRVIVPDLPGFGGSTRRVPDYSIAAHARYVGALLDSLGVARAHLVGYSMGGGVAILLGADAPDRVASLVLVSSIGVQEYELLGDYLLNHAVHGLQLAGLWALTELVPHFGWMDHALLGVPYARNFYDTDQRPLREALLGWDGAALLVQGTRDVLVPPAIAGEHARIVPQSEVAMLPGGHFMVFTDADAVAAAITPFLRRVERGAAPIRANAEPARRAAADAPFDPATVPRPSGFSLLVLLVLLAAATFVSEDLACISAGLLVSRGTLGFVPATLACLIGITVGDLLLFFVGRVAGRPAVRRAPLRWLVTEADVERASRWFNRRGMRLVLTTRFLPGTRLPTYLAAGVLRTDALRFAGAFLLAAALWTPLLVGISTVAGGSMLRFIAGHERVAGPLFVGGLLTLFLLVRTATALSTWRGRRLLLGRWRRLTRWEFWPRWRFYPPVVLYVGWLALRHRSAWLFTCANPAMPAGGLVGESKADILRGLAHAPDRVAPWVLVPADGTLAGRLQRVARWKQDHGLRYPVVLKPDVGERGSGVMFARSDDEVEAYLAAAGDAVIAQAMAPGREFGVFYARLPDEPAGRIFSITDKRFPTVTGDGRRTLEQLILADDRAVCLGRRLLRAHAARLDEVPAAGEPVTLTDLGTHSRGATFLDGSALETPALAEAFDRLSRGYDGFWFGRYDVRTPSEESLQAGGPFTVIELNGVSSEATAIYDPGNGLVSAYRTLFRQWRLAFAIGAANRARGARPATWPEVFRLLRRHRRATRAHVDPEAVRTAGRNPPAGPGVEPGTARPVVPRTVEDRP